MNKRISDITSEGLSLLLDYSFPGNIRNWKILESHDNVNKEIIEKELLFFLEKKEFTPQPGTLKEMEREMIKKSLIQNKGNRTKAAEQLGISRRTLIIKLKEYQIDIKPER